MFQLPETGVNPSGRNAAPNSTTLTTNLENDILAKGLKEIKLQIQEAINSMNAVKVVLKDPLASFDESAISPTLGRIEKLSLYFYLILVFLTIFMFFVHKWWY